MAITLTEEDIRIATREVSSFEFGSDPTPPPTEALEEFVEGLNDKVRKYGDAMQLRGAAVVMAWVKRSLERKPVCLFSTYENDGKELDFGTLRLYVDIENCSSDFETYVDLKEVIVKEYKEHIFGTGEPDMETRQKLINSVDDIAKTLKELHGQQD